MKFFKSFSLLHRRTRSDPSTSQGAAWIFGSKQRPKDELRPSLISDTHLSTLAQPEPDTPLSSLPAAVPEAATNLAKNLRIFELQLENDYLKHGHADLSTQVADLRIKLARTQSQHLADLHAVAQKSQELQKVCESFSKCEKLLGLLSVDPYIQSSVFSAPCSVILKGEDAEQSLVDAVKKASSTPGSPWQAVMSSARGTRTVEEYESALQVALKARKDLRHMKNRAHYWKNLAKRHEQTEDFITPSNSELSAVYEPLPPERQQALDALIKKRKAVRYQAVEKFGSVSLDDTTLVVDSLSNSSIASDTQSSSTIHSSVGNPSSCYKPKLAPLASETFRKDLSKYALGEPLLKRSSTASCDLMLGRLDYHPQKNEEMGADFDARSPAASSAISPRHATYHRKHGISRPVRSSIRMGGSRSALADYQDVASKSKSRLPKPVLQSFRRLSRKLAPSNKNHHSPHALKATDTNALPSRLPRLISRSKNITAKS